MIEEYYDQDEDERFQERVDEARFYDIVHFGKQTECSTCKGYGLWAMGSPVPMGRLDAGDGLPTKACPECGANANPIGED